MSSLATPTHPKLKPVRFELRQYLAMIGGGIIPHDARVELLDGRLVGLMTKFAPHNFASRGLGVLLRDVLGPGWLVSEEKSVVLGRYWRPEPDIAVIRGPNDRYRTTDPVAADIGLLVEIADSSYSTDRGEKWRAYAAARVPTYWIVNLNRSLLEVYRMPSGRGRKATYGRADHFGPDDEVPIIVEGWEAGRFAVKDVLP